MRRDIGIDLGTANTLVFIKGKGIILREPSVVAVSQATGQILAMGNEARDMLGRTPGSINAIRPMKDGVIANFEITGNMLKHFIKKSLGAVMFKPSVVMCIPSNVTEVERRAATEVVMQAGAKEVFLVEEPIAAAIGAKLPVDDPIGSMIVDIGGGTTEIAVISLGGIVSSRSVRVAGNEFDNTILNYMKKKHSIFIGERTAEDIKTQIGSAYKTESECSIEIRGRDLIDGLPKAVSIDSIEIRDILSDGVNVIVDAVRATLETTSPELASDVIERGITLAGGGALLKGMDRIISEKTGIPVNIAENPLDCAAMGTGKCLDSVETLRKVAAEKK